MLYHSVGHAATKDEFVKKVRRQSMATGSPPRRDKLSRKRERALEAIECRHRAAICFYDQ